MGVFKKCFKCGIEQPLENYYKHPQMSDGRLNKCKTCNKKDVSLNYFKKIEDPEFAEKERLRSRKKYHRLNYKEKYKRQEHLNKKEYKGLSKKLRIPKFYNAHHWSYKDEYIYDVCILDRRTHRRIHKYLIFNKEFMCFNSKDGDLLDSREKHYKYLESKGFF